MNPAATRTALITGFTGQDGTFLTAHLLAHGYRVIGLTRRISTEPPRRVRGKFDFSNALMAGDLVLESGDLLSVGSLIEVIQRHQPDEIYNLAAQSHVGASFAQPEFTMASILEGTVNLITALQAAHITGIWRMYQASTSEMFGGDHDGFLDESSEFDPKSPYAIAKAAAHYYCRMKRAQGLFISCGILFNHESEIRGGDFVTQKIVHGLLRWMNDPTQPLELGNLDARRDWGYAGEYVDAMWRMLQYDTPDDWVVAFGQSHSIREFVEATANYLGLKLDWIGQGLGEVGVVDSQTAVRIDPKFYRPNEVKTLVGYPVKALEKLSWQAKVDLAGLVKIMVDYAR